MVVLGVDLSGRQEWARRGGGARREALDAAGRQAHSQEGAARARRERHEGGVGRQARLAEGGRKRKKGKEEKKREEKREKEGKRRNRKGTKIEKGKVIGKMGKSLGKLGEFLGKLGERIFLWGFPFFSGVSGIFGTTVMARRTGRRDRGVRGISGAVADNGARLTGGGATARVQAVPAGFAARAPRVRSGFRRG
jgi:hypothetical protein